jgi:hypothetical protein
VCLFTVALAPGIVLATTGTSIMGLTLGPVNVLSTVLEQRETPDELRARLRASSEFAAGG